MDVDELAEKVPEFEDPLEPIGVAVGGFLVLVGIATVVGMPWRFTSGILASVLQLIGILGTIAVGAILVWLAQTRRDELPGT